MSGMSDWIVPGIEYFLSEPSEPGDMFILSANEFTIQITISRKTAGTGIGISVYHPDDDPRGPFHSEYITVPAT